MAKGIAPKRRPIVRTATWKCLACGVTGSSTIGDNAEAEGRIASLLHRAVSPDCLVVGQIVAQIEPATGEREERG